ncbi:MAG TPA: class I SAM-dependent methyltransferase [Thermoanaerobaculia bacterium]|jgi:SAM-dependent methyltransferase
MAWYKEWFGEEYLELYAHRDAGEADLHVDFVVGELGGAPRAVLDLACGAGRHTAALRRRGLRALGVDLSLTLLAHSPRRPAVAGDMRCLPFADATFDWVLNFFTSFGYFERERENFQVLEEIVRLLTPEGRFLIDFLNREHVLAGLEPREVRERDGRRVEIERWYDEATRRINKRIRLDATGGAPETYLESVRAYTRAEVAIGLRWAGLEVDATFGNFHGDPFQSDSERLIIVGHKPA